MRWIVLVVLALWFVSGSPKMDVANWFWEQDVAPWEKVDAFYYPDRDDLTVSEERADVGSVNACREAVRSMAAIHGDPTLQRGDYECGVGWSGTIGLISVYRATVE